MAEGRVDAAVSIVRKVVFLCIRASLFCVGELSPPLQACALYIILKIVQLGLIYGAKQAQGWWKRQEQRYID